MIYWYIGGERQEVEKEIIGMASRLGDLSRLQSKN
ncbi:uncharacterized protein G2W53_023475 [Senna tora]|uniref:Uncharacterized protein n=1 Tax=Senna tora TaxID=362788 RepID=A0A834TB94_9FABA|nr:uncharacterized protein G2W53_023475 [Senna tora]